MSVSFTRKSGDNYAHEESTSLPSSLQVSFVCTKINSINMHN